jgi:hypothetical protein
MQGPKKPSIQQTSSEPSANKDDEAERCDEHQSRFDEEYQGEAWKINENTEGKED